MALFSFRTPTQSAAQLAVLDEPTVARIKAGVRDYWDARAPSFDLGDSYVRRSDDVRCAWRSVFSEILGATPRSILDVGSGTGELALLFHELGHHPRGIDLAPKMVELARAKVASLGFAIPFDEGDAERLPFADASFDALHARHVVWTLPRPERALAEWVRVLRPGGVLVITESFRDGLVDDAWTRFVERGGRQLSLALRRIGLGSGPVMPPKPAAYPGRELLPYEGGLGPRRSVPFLERAGLRDVQLRDLVWLRDRGRASMSWVQRLGQRRKNVYYAAWGVKPAGGAR